MKSEKWGQKNFGGEFFDRRFEGEFEFGRVGAFGGTLTPALSEWAE
jgi:hypothetical protein